MHASHEMSARTRRSWRCALGVGLAVLGGSPAATQEPPLTRIAFGSCAHQEKPQPIWDAVLDYRPELFIFAGDNVYGDVTSGAMSELEAAYARAATIEGYARVRATVPVLATWDDHDFGRNDGGADFAHKAAAKRLFLDFWRIPDDDPRRAREGIYHAEIFGPEGMRVQVILLDTRTFRSPLRAAAAFVPGRGPYVPDPDPAKTMLGAAQWAWLRARLAQPAELRLVVSSVQVLAEAHGWERWGNLPAERDRLLELIEQTGAEGVVFLSGDRHVGALYRRPGEPYDLYELTSSGINMTFAANRDDGPRRLGAVYGAENFGTIDIDWWAREIRLAVRSMNGEPVREVIIPLATLRTG
ncbi:MAG TPA: alkaline phosphatase D family protein [Geminicoccaceae bacterium]|nr:alkaline phosphatase D family protein [Geminicoccaceae bacterium]